jgi:PTH1 family peptidyl-tRNA hydrolase
MSRLAHLFNRFRTPSKGAEGGRETAGEPLSWVVAGLGNPGGNYARSRHNMGFRVIARIAGQHGIQLDRLRFKALCAQVSLNDRAVMLVMPQTFYTASGESVAAILNYFKVPVGRLIVVHDDLDLEAGRLRLKRGGGDAGNRGVRSISEALGSPEFIRIRVGIGRPPGMSDSKDFVLHQMTAAELREFDPVIERAAEAVSALVAETLERVMERFNQRI